MNEFCEQIADILDVAEVKGADVLRDFEEWDSLSVLSTIAMLDARYGINITAVDLKDIRTVAELWDLVQARKE